MFVLYNTETKEYEEFSTRALLEMLNRDSSDDWSDYDKDSTIKEIQEGVNEFCHPYIVKE